ncbi:microviridin/marinostatin family tricyclic proteinase inhibitor [Nodularia sphaerocarpa]
MLVSWWKKRLHSSQIILPPSPPIYTLKFPSDLEDF